MISIENTEVVGWETAIRGMRNPMNSWEKSDSGYCGGDHHIGCAHCACMEDPVKNDEMINLEMKYEYGIRPCGKRDFDGSYQVGYKDLSLMMSLAQGGPVHAKYRRMIVVYTDITAPLYWWKEFDTYKIGTVANSCSTMHKIHEKEFALEDFSHEHLDIRTRPLLEEIISTLNDYRNLYVNYAPNDFEVYGCPSKKDIWWQIIQLLPSSYNQKRTVMLNYEVLAGIYPMRKNHKLDEWCLHETLDEDQNKTPNFASGKWGFCDWIESLPYSEIITGKQRTDE